MDDLPTGKGNMTSTGKLIMALLVLFVIAGVVLLAIGVHKAGNSDLRASFGPLISWA
jgi:hypothetical protein